MIHPVHLFEVKKPEESKYPYDYYKLVTTIPAEQAFRPIAEVWLPDDQVARPSRISRTQVVTASDSKDCTAPCAVPDDVSPTTTATMRSRVCDNAIPRRGASNRRP